MRYALPTLLALPVVFVVGCGGPANDPRLAEDSTPVSSSSTSATGPYGGTATPIPGRLEAEDYDLGGEGVGYSDTTPGNAGHAFRSDDVDIQATTDAGGGYNVGWIVAGEWLAFTVNIATAGSYSVTARVASGISGAKDLHLELDGQRLTGGTFTFSGGAGWQTWNDVTAAISLPQGTHLLKVAMDSTSFNLNYLEFTLVKPACTLSTTLESNCGALFGIYANPPGTSWLSKLQAREQEVGRTFDIAHAYHGWDQMEAGQVPSSDETSLIQQGQVLLLNMTPIRYSNGTYVTWQQVAAGDSDATIVATAKRFAALAPHPIMVIFSTEPDQPTTISKFGGGTATAWTAAYLHFRSLFVANGATNVIWCLDFTGYSGNYASMLAMNPGTANFDWYGFDPYDTQDTKGGFYNTVQPTAAWIDQNHQADGKPIMLPEYGVDEDPSIPTYKETWQANIAADLKKLPRVRAVSVFDSGSAQFASSRIDTSADSLAGFKQAAAAPYVNVLH